MTFARHGPKKTFLFFYSFYFFFGRETYVCVRVVVRPVSALRILKTSLNGSVHIIVGVYVAAAVGRLRDVASGNETGSKGKDGGDGEELHLEMCLTAYGYVDVFFVIQPDRKGTYILSTH